MDAAAHGSVNGHSPAIKALLAGGANVTARTDNGITPLHVAAIQNHPAAIEALLAGGADIDAKDDGATPLHMAAFKGHPVAAQVLLAAGANVNAKAEGGATPLHDAADQNHPAVIEALLAGGANIHAKAIDGATPLHVAIKIALPPSRHCSLSTRRPKAALRRCTMQRPTGRASNGYQREGHRRRYTAALRSVLRPPCRH